MVLDNVKLPATLETIMDTWIFQMNYPLVTVNRDYLTGTATVAQVGEKYRTLWDHVVDEVLRNYFTL